MDVENIVFEYLNAIKLLPIFYSMHSVDSEPKGALDSLFSLLSTIHHYLSFRADGPQKFGERSPCRGWKIKNHRGHAPAACV